MTILEGIALVLTAIGVFFIVLSAIGILRLPDLYTRVHAVGKAGTLGVIGVLLAVGAHFADLLISVRMIALIAFFLITAPVAAHMLDRAAYLIGVKPIPTTKPDDLAGAYNQETRQLR